MKKELLVKIPEEVSSIANKRGWKIRTYCTSNKTTFIATERRNIGLNEEENIEVIIRANSMKELTDPELLYPIFVEGIDRLLEPDEAWLYAAGVVINSYFPENNNRVGSRPYNFLFSVSRIIADHIRKNEIFRYSDFYEDLGGIQGESGNYHRFMRSCPGSGLAKRMHATAKEVINRYESNK